MAPVTWAGMPVEIMRDILDHIEEPVGKTLLSVALVCRLWSNIALDFLWRGDTFMTPPICVLHDMYDKGSLVKYLPIIRHLSLHRGLNTCYSYQQKAQPTECPRVCPADQVKFFAKMKLHESATLDSLSLLFGGHLNEDICGGEITDLARNIISPNLRRLTVQSADLETGFYALILNRAPELQEICISKSMDPAVADEQLEFLKQMPGLKSIRLIPGTTQWTTIVHLANRPTLQEVAFSIPGWDFDKLPNTSFANLRKLEMAHQTADPIIPLPPGLVSLTLRLLLSKTNRKVLSSIAALKHMQELCITAAIPNYLLPRPRGSRFYTRHVHGRATFSLQNVCQVFKGCKELRDVRLKIVRVRNHKGSLVNFNKLHSTPTIDLLRSTNAVYVIELTPMEYRELLAAVPQRIQRLELPYEASCGMDELNSLQDFPSLRELGICGDFRMEEIDAWQDPPSFPLMKQVLWAPSYDDSRQISEVNEPENFETLHRIFPNLDLSDTPPYLSKFSYRILYS